MKKITLFLFTLMTYTIGFSQITGGTYTVGSGGTYNYTSLSAAAADFNTAVTGSTLTGDVTLQIMTNITETTNIGLINTTDFTLTITPGSASLKTITFNTAYNLVNNATGSIVLGCNSGLTWTDLTPSKNIVIDGGYAGSSEKFLKILVNATAYSENNPISVLDGSHNITIKNCVLQHLGARTITNTGAGSQSPCLQIKAVTDKTSTMPYNLTIQNNEISLAGINGTTGIGFDSRLSTGGGYAVPGTLGGGSIISENKVTARFNGINIWGINGIIVDNNEVHITGQGQYGSGEPAGIGTNSSQGTAANYNSGSIIISNNKILELNTSSTQANSGVIGIMSTNKGGSYQIYNNFITGFSWGGTTASTNSRFVGIGLHASNSKVYHNIVILNALSAATKPAFVADLNSSNKVYAGIYVGNTNSGQDISNNILISRETTVNSVLIGNGYNADSFYSGDGNILYFSGSLATFTKAVNSFTTYGTTYPGSKNVNVVFTNESTGDLHLAGTSIRDLNLAVSPQAIVTTDVDGTTRNTTKTYAGADEAALPFSLVIHKDENINLTGITDVYDLIVQGGAKLTLASGATANVQGNLIIDSNVDGNGTFVNNGTLNITGTAIVNQYLPSVRNWYMSYPVSSANVSLSNSATATYYTHSEPGASVNDGWSSALTSFPTVSTGQGFIVRPSGETTISYSGTLNGSSVSQALTNTTGTPKPGFNLIGNPYPSYLTWSVLATANASSLFEKTMWYRTVNGSSYVFATVNGDGIEANGGTNLIPPMQGFWVRAAATAGNFTIQNSDRSHNTSGTANPLKVKAASTFPLLRLAASNGVQTDESLIYFSANSSDGKDAYDAQKMMNGGNAPDIYTFLSGAPIAINSMNSIPYDTDIAVGFNAPAAGSYSISATEIVSLDGTSVILKDKLNNIETDLTQGVYNFTADIGTTDNRFAIVFPKSGVPTSVKDNTANKISFFTTNGGIVLSGIKGDAVAKIFNSVGQQIASKELSSEVTSFNQSFLPGVYIVKVLTNGREFTGKVVVK